MNEVITKIDENPQERKIGDYTVIDFETANHNRFSMCQVGIVTVENYKIVDEYKTLIYPPFGDVQPRFSQIHGITKDDIRNCDIFPDVLYSDLKDRLNNKFMVAHNESFDRGVLEKTMDFYELPMEMLNILNPLKFDCTMKIYRNYKFLSGALKYLTNDLDIELNHHDALSDSRACAELYLKHITKDFKAKF